MHNYGHRGLVRMRTHNGLGAQLKCVLGLPSWKSAQFTHCWMHSGPSQFGRCLAIMFAICHWVLERLINSHANWKHKFDSEMTFVLGNLSQVLQITSLEAKHNLDLVKCQIRNQSINTQIKPTAQIVIERYWHIMGILPSTARPAPPQSSLFARRSSENRSSSGPSWASRAE